MSFRAISSLALVVFLSPGVLANGVQSCNVSEKRKMPCELKTQNKSIRFSLDAKTLLWVAPNSSVNIKSANELSLESGKMLITGAQDLKLSYLVGEFDLVGDFFFGVSAEDLSFSMVTLAGVVRTTEKKWSQIGGQPGYLYKIEPLQVMPWRSPVSLTRLDFFKTLLEVGVEPKAARSTWDELAILWSQAAEQIQTDFFAIQEWQRSNEARLRQVQQQKQAKDAKESAELRALFRSKVDPDYNSYK